MSERRLACVVVDDEPLARAGLRKYIAASPFLIQIGECRDTVELEGFLAKSRPDLIFLDIEMPGKNGMKFLEGLESMPQVIMTTAYSQFATKGFDLDVVDYLVKPFSRERFNTAVAKARELQSLRTLTSSRTIFIKENKSHVRLYLSDVIFLQAMENYVAFVTKTSKYIVHKTLSNSIALLGDGRFVQVHKSFAVNKDHITTVRESEVVIGETRIPVSRSYKRNLLDGFKELM